MDKERVQILLSLARDLASQRTDAGLTKAFTIIANLIDEGCQDAEVLILAASCLLQGPQGLERQVRQKAISLVDEAVTLAPENISVLENAIDCYVLILKEFPDKLDEIVRLSLNILDLDPCNVEAMITLATYRNHPRVNLSLEDTIGMMEWAKEIKPANIIIHFTLAKLYGEAGKLEKAQALYAEIVPEAPLNLPQETPLPGESPPSRRKSSRKPYRKYGIY
jgi:tetratricopeptide (TPR) repeat protein